MAKKWIQSAIKHPGALHKMLGIPLGQKIPLSRLQAAAHSGNDKLRHRAQMAINLRHLNPWKIMHDKMGYWVVKEDTGAKVHKMPHKTRAEALKHMRALYAAEGFGKSAPNMPAPNMMK